MRNYIYEVTYEVYEGEQYKGHKTQQLIAHHCAVAAGYMEDRGFDVVDVKRIGEIDERDSIRTR